MITDKDHKDLLSEVASYYTEKLIDFGETAKGVDWNSSAGQDLRFEQLCKLITVERNFSINDLGCGYGALLDYLQKRFSGFTYSGFDVSRKMVETARARYPNLEQVKFEISEIPDDSADFGIASGIFNVRQQRSDGEWLKYIENTLDVLNETSQLGFAFNCLTSYSDEDKMQSHLFYADPCYFFNRCKLRYSRNVSLLHDYDLYEFTILVRKEP